MVNILNFQSLFIGQKGRPRSDCMFSLFAVGQVLYYLNSRPNNGMCLARIPRYRVQNFTHTTENQNHVTYIDSDFCLLLLIFANRLDSDQGAQWLSGRVLDSRPRGRGFEPHRHHCVVVLEQGTFILA